MKKLKIGYLALSKLSWKTPRIEAIARDTAAGLAKLEGCGLVAPDGLVTSEKEAKTGAEMLDAAGIDLLVMHFVTFPAGALIPVIAERIQAPIVLLANPEGPIAYCLLPYHYFTNLNVAF